jgi:regulator of PEP synthase PpsR (kinase-PPPase family)
MKGATKEVHVYVLSDATGTTAEAVIKAVLVQFKEIHPVVHRFNYVRDKETIEGAVKEATQTRGILIYSLVSENLRDWAKKKGQASGLPLFDLLGPLLGKLEKVFNLLPELKPGILRHLDEESLQLAEAIDFTLKHDDGLGLGSINASDVIILGASRTSKTPTSIYLSCNKIKASNVPVILNAELPRPVLEAPALKVGFTIDHDRLSTIRKARLGNRGKAMDRGYSDLSYIIEELEYCERLYRKIPGIRVINVTYLSIEEIAQQIMSWLR